MKSDEIDMRDACDAVFRSLQIFLLEPTPTNRENLITLSRHYTTFGYQFRLQPGSVTCSRRLQPATVRGSSSSPSQPVLAEVTSA